MVVLVMRYDWLRGYCPEGGFPVPLRGKRGVWEIHAVLETEPVLYPSPG